MKPPLLSFSENSKRLLMDPDVIEIPPPPPPPPPPSRPNKRPKDIMREVIDVDNDEDALDVIILDEKIDTKNKGKAIEDDADVYNHTKVKEALANYICYPPESSVGGSHKPIIIDGVNSDLLNGSDYIDICSDDFMAFDEYAYLQAHFDNVDIPPGVEAPIPSLLDSVHKAKKTLTRSASFSMADQNDLYPLDSWAFNNAERSKKLASVSNSAFQVAVNSGKASGANLTSSSSSFLQTAQSRKKQTSTQHGVGIVNPTPLVRKRTPATSRSSTWKLRKMPISFDNDPLYAKQYTALLKNNKGGTNTPFWPAKLDNIMASSISDYKLKLKSSFADLKYPSYPGFFDPINVEHNLPEQGVARSPKNVNVDDILRKYQAFKQFDTVEDHADHHYASNGSSVKQPAKNWAKRIQEEWKILKKDLPDTIYVRVYESRMDLLRAVIIGAEGTPYHDGLFFFDVCFPSGYPNVPPNVHYHSGGLRLNPNLYNTGKVCLSLLGTWHGSKNEKWQPGVSTVLQVLVSIQALILNQKPFFNEPGYAVMNGSADGEKRSLEYNENTFMLSLKTMIYSMRRPPKHFEDFALGHFHKYGHDILVACKAYMEGAQVGCLVKGGVQDVDEGDKSCSMGFKNSLPPCVDLLHKELSLIGVKNCEQFQFLAKTGINQVRNIPTPAI
ncbi:probable ubiquitin-conjugating enzyme E2 25 isoform X2 [Euphorbia lathyris]|uniref:probable ubiquitin-conjugating enzyme E2 25 isoform X2 n=1 Tax=Euphorbia lathyris TaxID=212925 RepID=UPI00331329A3